MLSVDPQSRFASVVYNIFLGPLRLGGTLNCAPVTLKFQIKGTKQRWGPWRAQCQLKKPFKERKGVSTPISEHQFALEANEWFETNKRKPKFELMAKFGKTSVQRKRRLLLYAVNTTAGVILHRQIEMMSQNSWECQFTSSLRQRPLEKVSPRTRARRSKWGRARDLPESSTVGDDRGRDRN